MTQRIVANRYRLGKPIGKGAFGEIFSGIKSLCERSVGVDMNTGIDVAIKIVLILSVKMIGEERSQATPTDARSEGL